MFSTRPPSPVFQLPNEDFSTFSGLLERAYYRVDRDGRLVVGTRYLCHECEAKHRGLHTTTPFYKANFLRVYLDGRGLDTS